MPPKESDVVVIGGGPAGSACAVHLAQLGIQVTLLDRGPSERQHVGETLPASSLSLLATLGLELRDEDVRMRPPEHRVYWGSRQRADRRPPPGPEGASLLIWRGGFDRSLQALARSRGVVLRESCVVARVEKRSGHDGGYRLSCREGAHAHQLETRFLVDASGRSGVLARSFRRRETGYRTLALTGHWQTDETDPPTIVEAFPGGWVWSAPLKDGLRDVTVMIEPRPGNDRRGLYHDALSRTKEVGELVRSARPLEAVRGIDATPYRARRFAGDDFLLLGDAGSFLDPLSAHGVHKALDAALAGAAVLRTQLSRPSDSRLAVRFFQEREENIYRVTAERLTHLYRQETRYAEEPFWRKRAYRATEPTGSSAPGPPPLPPLTCEMRLAPREGVRLIETAVLVDDFVERQEALTLDEVGRPVRYYGSLSLPVLFRRAIEAPDVGSAARGAGAKFDEAFQAIDWLYRSGYLRSRESG